MMYNICLYVVLLGYGGRASVLKAFDRNFVQRAICHITIFFSLLGNIPHVYHVTIRIEMEFISNLILVSIGKPIVERERATQLHSGHYQCLRSLP